MIITLHGPDLASSYQRLNSLVENYKDFLKIRLDAKTNEQQLVQEVLTGELFESKKIIIAENFLSPLKKLPKFLEKVPKDVILIFWESKELSPAKIKNLEKLAKIEFFKEKTELFSFLDSLYPASKNALAYFPKVNKTEGLIWHIQNRLFLLILSKLNIDSETAGNIIKKKIFGWQWDKIKNQSSRFNLQTLENLFAGAMRIDYMIKSGKTELSPNMLITMLFLKYLK